MEREREREEGSAPSLFKIPSKYGILLTELWCRLGQEFGFESAVNTQAGQVYNDLGEIPVPDSLKKIIQ